MQAAACSLTQQPTTLTFPFPTLNTFKNSISTCSSRSEGGTTPLHTELEALVADFLGVEDSICYGMGFATNSASLPVLCGESYVLCCAVL